jgi:hypothetical protein
MNNAGWLTVCIFCATGTTCDPPLWHGLKSWAHPDVAEATVLTAAMVCRGDEVRADRGLVQVEHSAIVSVRGLPIASPMTRRALLSLEA